MYSRNLSINLPKKPKSRQEILKQKQQSTFVGREEQIALFRHNLALTPESWCFLFNVWGQGGVGKSTLLRQFRKIAEEADFVTAYTSESETTVLEVMERLAAQVEQQGYKLNQFGERYKIYRQKKQELESDPEVPQGFSVFLGRSIAKAGLGLAKQIPGSGVVTPFLDEDVISTQAGEWASYIAKKLHNKDEVRLVQEPVEVLTPMFLQDLGKLAEQVNLTLFFDTYECTCHFLDGWLREILQGRYGDLPINLILVISGRQELNKDYWADYEGAIISLPLNPFTEDETKQYLARKGITNPQVIDVILRLSGCLPLLVAILAAESPNDPNLIGDPSGTAVERFLKWVDDPKRRQIALDAALPRLLNQDIIAVLHGEVSADDLFLWLKAMPFVEEHVDGWAYHDIARTQMLRHKKLTSPKSWTDLHSKLVGYYDASRANLQLTTKKQWGDPMWKTHSLHYLYHCLCQSPQQNLSKALSEFLAALDNQWIFAERWAETIAQAGRDAEVSEVQHWGEILVEGLKAYREGRYEVTVRMFTDLIKQTEIEDQIKLSAIYRRGNLYHTLTHYDKALQDFETAIQMAADKNKAVTSKGWTHYIMGQFEEAIEDFNHAIELNPNDVRALGLRGKTYTHLGRYKEALIDFDKAIELDPDSAWTFEERCYAHRGLGHHEEALKDLETALPLAEQFIQQNPANANAFMNLGVICFALKLYERALEAFNRAIELDPHDVTAFTMRGKLHRTMNFYKEALNDFNHVIELYPRYQWTIRERGETYRMMGYYQDALKDFDRIIKLQSNDVGAIIRRGQIHCLLECYEDALKDFNQAITLRPDNAEAIGKRGETYLMLKHYREAIEDFNRVNELLADNDWYLYERALAYKVLDQAPGANTDLERAIQLAQQKYNEDPENWNNTFNLALYHLAADNVEQVKPLYRNALAINVPQSRIQVAIQDLNYFLRVFPNHKWARKAKVFWEKKGISSDGVRV